MILDHGPTLTYAGSVLNTQPDLDMADEDITKIKEYSHVVHVTLSNYKANGAD